MMTENTHLRIKNCDLVIRLSGKEVESLRQVLAESAGHAVLIGEFGCAIGTGYIVEVDGRTVDITDYESW